MQEPPTQVEPEEFLPGGFVGFLGFLPEDNHGRRRMEPSRERPAHASGAHHRMGLDLPTLTWSQPHDQHGPSDGGESLWPHAPPERPRTESERSTDWVHHCDRRRELLHIRGSRHRRRGQIWQQDLACWQGSGNQIRSSSVWDQADEEAAFCGGPSEGLGHRCDPDRRRRRFARSSFSWSDQDGVAGPKDEPPLPGSSLNSIGQCFFGMPEVSRPFVARGYDTLCATPGKAC